MPRVFVLSSSRRRLQSGILIPPFSVWRPEDHVSISVNIEWCSVRSWLPCAPPPVKASSTTSLGAGLTLDVVSNSCPTNKRNWFSSFGVRIVCWLYTAPCSMKFQLVAADGSVTPPAPWLCIVCS